MVQKARIEKKISPHKLRHTYATNLLNAGAERVDIKALLGHESVATTQIYTNVGQERMEKVVGMVVSIYRGLRCEQLAKADYFLGVTNDYFRNRERGDHERDNHWRSCESL